MRCRSTLGALALFVALSLGATGFAVSTPQIWTVLAFDAKGDGRDPSLPDAAQLSYRYDQQQDMLWFRLSLYGKANQDAFGVNIVMDTGGDDAAKMNWWGSNKDFKFDKLVTAWVTRAGGRYHGTIGVGDAAGAKAKNFNNLVQNNLEVRTEGDAIVVGLKRSDLTDKMKMSLIAAVGSNERWNDDIPNATSVTLDLAAARPTRGLRELDFGRNNFRLPSTYKTLANDQPPLIVRKGRGRETLILIPGVYSGSQVFDEFMKRNESQYRFYLVTPPGLNGTSARPLPPETTSYGELSWTRRLERDVLDLISREKLNRPVIVAHGFPGSLIAAEMGDGGPPFRRIGRGYRHRRYSGAVLSVAQRP